MTPRLARMALAAFAVLAVGVTYNALRRQEGATVDAKAVAEQAHPRTGERQERTEKAKPGRVKPRHSASAPDAVTADAPADATDPVGAETVRAIQRELKQRGYGPLANDGVMRPVTRAAIMAFEHENRLPLTGEATEGLLRHLVLGVPAAPEAPGAGKVQSSHAEALIKQVQRQLTERGYRPGPSDGRLSAETVTAIRLFERDQGLAPKGRISAEVFSRLQERAASPTVHAER